jgi:hypothetical protein
MRSESLIKAQKKYLQKIKDENSIVYQNMKKKHLLYQKQYMDKLREDEDKFIQYKKERAIYAKSFYNENKIKILEKRFKLRLIKKNLQLDNNGKIDKIEI